MLSLKAAALVLAASITVQGLQLLKPTPGGCHGSKAVLKAGGLANISWIVEPGDPESITFQLQNDLTLDSWQVATKVETARGSAQWTMDGDVTQSDMYYLQATNIECYCDQPAVRSSRRGTFWNLGHGRRPYHLCTLPF
ncbi:hypothetical protein EDD18DRAFT_470427 [Armillaria luteobubalina]|uniref:Yeast cell wall synthesis Kre9/Knh1-like N-terminal domain-containing protein n=1 Tax=Armillaria luteobubalina TaxID=153913 RepID=A0AA39V332_9AGAR|nr:hypothetical protein EDD18DRAFT_470427 [Armillaria luteobubalina]